MKASDFMKRYEKQHQNDDKVDEHLDHSLQAHAKERAQHPDEMHAGTAFDWEDMDAYRKELKRLERDGPGAPKRP